jgi:hypothetical protein
VALTYAQAAQLSEKILLAIIASGQDTLGASISSAIAGTQYTEGDTDASITGRAAMFESDTTTSTLKAVSPDFPLPVVQAALARTVDAVAVAYQTDAIMNGSTALTQKFAKIDAASSGSNTIIAAVTGKKIRVLSYDLVCASAVAVTWRSNATALSGAKSFAANGGQVKNLSELGHLETVAGEALNLNLGTAVQVSGELTYVEV